MLRFPRQDALLVSRYHAIDRLSLIDISRIMLVDCKRKYKYIIGYIKIYIYDQKVECICHNVSNEGFWYSKVQKRELLRVTVC